VTDVSVVGEYLHWCIVVVFVAQLLWSLQDDSSQVVVKQEVKEATDKRGEEAAAAEGSQMSLSRAFCEANNPCIVAERKIKELHSWDWGAS